MVCGHGFNYLGVHMKYTYPQLKEASKNISDHFGIDIKDSNKIIGALNKDEDALSKIISGDYDQIPTIASSLDIIISGAAKNEMIPAEDDISPTDILPPDITDTIQNTINDYMSRFGIEDMKKASAEQWQGACICVGKMLQKSRILEDREREKKQGGKIYNPEVVGAMVEIWRVFCMAYDKAPLAVDFIAFVGVSSEWFYGGAHGQGQRATTAGSWLRKKVLQIQEGGLGARLVDGRKNPTGTIFFMKNVHGWRDQREVIHTDGGEAQAAAIYPAFDIIEDNHGEV